MHVGLEESKISAQLMQGISIQLIDEDMGVPISEESLIKASKDPEREEVLRCLCDRP